VSRIIDADNRWNLLLFNAGAHYADNKCGADSGRAPCFRVFGAIFAAFSVEDIGKCSETAKIRVFNFSVQVVG
jgi:hypothetical protein